MLFHLCDSLLLAVVLTLPTGAIVEFILTPSFEEDQILDSLPLLQGAVDMISIMVLVKQHGQRRSSTYFTQDNIQTCMTHFKTYVLLNYLVLHSPFSSDDRRWRMPIVPVLPVVGSPPPWSATHLIPLDLNEEQSPSKVSGPSLSMRGRLVAALGAFQVSLSVAYVLRLSPSHPTSIRTRLPATAIDDEVDVAIIGAGLGGLCAGAILNTLYNQTVGIYESHYLAGGCAHAYDRQLPNGATLALDSGPTILLGCSSPPFNALQQVLEAVRQPVDWIPYDGWGMIEKPGREDELRWRLELGPGVFEEGPLLRFGGTQAVQEFKDLQQATRNLLAGAEIPALAMRSGPTALVPLLRYFPTLVKILQQGDATTGTFSRLMDGPEYVVTNEWLRNWLDALAFSLSGLPAARTSAAAMAFVLNDMHRAGAALDYPKGGMGSIVDALVRGVEQGEQGSKVNLRQHVSSINFDGKQRVTGIALQNGKLVNARVGVICNAPVWSLRKLLKDEALLGLMNNLLPLEERQVPTSWTTTDEGSSIKYERPESQKETLLGKRDSSEMTASFLHLHLVLDATGLDLDSLEAHYTVMDRSLSGDTNLVVNGVKDGPCGELNMIAVSNPSIIDRTLAPEGHILVHAYGAGNEPYEVWEGLDRRSEEYKMQKEDRARVLWRAVESVIPDARERVVLEEIGSPLTHERFLRRPRGTYGAATEDYLPNGSTPISNLVLAGDGVFPGIGVPAVAISGASAANALMSVMKHWQCLDRLQV